DALRPQCIAVGDVTGGGLRPSRCLFCCSGTAQDRFADFLSHATFGKSRSVGGGQKLVNDGQRQVFSISEDKRRGSWSLRGPRQNEIASLDLHHFGYTRFEHANGMDWMSVFSRSGFP